MNTSIDTVLYTSKTLSNGEHPLMLRLTKERKRKYISLHISLEAKYWDADKSKPRKNCPNREKILLLIEQKTKEYEQQVIDFKTSDRDYTLHTLVSKASKVVIKQTVGTYLDGYIVKLQTENRVGNAKTFSELRTSLQKFCQSLDFYFIDIDLQWLESYERWLRTERGLSENSIGIRFRSLRVLYNLAIKDNLVRKVNYPFDEFKVSQFREQTTKRSVTKEDIRRLIEFDVTTLSEYNYPTPLRALAKDLFLFSYFCCGINLTDILHLKQENIISGRLSFHRQKTGKLISFRLQPAASEIIAKYRHSDCYLFPILDSKIHLTAKQQYACVQRTNKRVNKYLKQMGEHLNFPIPLTTYVARLHLPQF